ncbi:MAG: M42 family metallopeptidase [Victivallales bacterium]
MLSEKSLNFLEQLMKCSGPSGFEIETAAVFRKYLSQFAGKVYTDVTGNTIGILNEKSDFKVMLAGHYDEIGFQVVHIADEGLLYIRNVGGIDKLTVPGTEVELLTEKGRVHGVIGKKPIHLTEEKDRSQAIEIKNLWVDIGVENKKEAEKIVRVGDPVAVKSNFTRMGKNRIVSKGMDDKIGAFVVAETLRELSTRKINVAVYGVGTVQEELGLRGATTSAFGIAPNVGFAIDVGFATDTPDIEKKTLGSVSLGKGPILCRSADDNPVLSKILRATAKKKNIKYQDKAGYRASGGTDTAIIQLTRGGVATSLVSIPNRYMHTPVEMCDLRDVEAAIKLLVETILTLKPGQTFIPGID